MNRKSLYIFPVLFLALLFLPMINDLFKIWEFERSEENRIFKDDFNLHPFKEAPTEIDNYLNDNFSFRTPLLKAYNYIKYYGFKVSPNPENTRIGKDGWFFLAQKELEIAKGNKNFSNQQKEGLLQEWKRRKAYLEGRGIKVYWYVAPMKHYIYEAKLPRNIRLVHPSRTEELKNYFESEIPNFLKDITPDLKAAKKDNDIYKKLDNHWNDRAGLVLTELIRNQLKTDFPNSNIPKLPEIKWRIDTGNFGFHYNNVRIKELEEYLPVPILSDTNSIEVSKYNFPSEPPEIKSQMGELYEVRYQNPSIENGLKVLIIRDSFSNHIQPFIGELFEETVMIFDAWHYNMDINILDKVDPDVVIYINLETSTGNIAGYYGY